MATKKPTEGPKAKLMKLSVVTLRKKAKALNISNISGRTKENLVQSIMISESRKKGAAKRKTATKQGSLFRATRVSRSGEQSGRSDVVRDGMRRAMLPGKRLSRTGKVYYERRKNRSDMNPNVKPMLGEQTYNGWTNYWTWRWALEMIDPYQIWDSIDPDTNLYDLALYLKDEAEMLVEESSEGWAQSWLLGLLGDINWREIAESVMSDKE